MKSIYLVLVVFCAISVVAEAKRGRHDPEQEVTYLIPTEDKSLEPFATHTFRIEWESQEPGRRAFEYHLPSELDGVGQEIELFEVSPNRFEGSHATAVCEEGKPFRCRLKYKNLESNQEAAKSRIRSTYSDEAVIRGRMQVMMAFQADPEPEGVMTATGNIE